ncbi:hypothetical protein EG329_007651 [Mollisiaceae sp. DMI_Dod_QoI]|nr:hypothetical protein EG329_007651 [Helotiales sp. DMI_Dod_QoI]
MEPPRREHTAIIAFADASPHSIKLSPLFLAQGTQWPGAMPPGGRPHITCLPQEIHDKIQEFSDPVSLAILSVTCKALRIRLPIRGSLEDVVVVRTMVGENGKEIKMHELLKEYMRDGKEYRLYCGHYGIERFCLPKVYQHWRDKYWALNPQLPVDYFETPNFFEIPKDAIKDERGIWMWNIRDARDVTEAAATPPQIGSFGTTTMIPTYATIARSRIPIRPRNRHLPPGPDSYLLLNMSDSE